MSAIASQKTSLLKDPSLWLLLFSNLFTIGIAVIEGWDLLTILWIYWFQSVIIGIFSVIKILQAKKPSFLQKENIPNSDVVIAFIKIFGALFFIMHYGFFHQGYMIFLKYGAAAFQGGEAQPIDFAPIFLTAGLFFANHLYSFLYHRSRDNQNMPLPFLFFFPYVRIVPMHLTIIFAAFFQRGLIFFLLLKTGADILTHLLEHRFSRKKRT